MSYEINILVVNQERPVHLPFKSSVELCNEIEHEGFGRYHSYWPFFSCIQGIQYSLVTEDKPGWLSAMALCDADFDCPFSTPCPPWIPEQYAEEVFHPLIVEPEFYADFVRVLKFLLESSPNGFMMFQTRYEGGDRDVIAGTVSLDDFLAMLNRREVMFNVCYIVALKTDIVYQIFRVGPTGESVCIGHETRTYSNRN